MSETTTTPAAKLTLEKTTCGRCGGSGKYSYCQTMWGPFGPYTCFKCGGAGRLLTKRGVKAAAFIKRVFSKPARKAEVFPLVAEYQDLLTKAGKEPKAKAKAERVAEIKAALNVPADWDA